LQVGSESNGTTVLNHTKEDAYSQNIRPWSCCKNKRWE
jgi:hypothetical protein